MTLQWEELMYRMASHVPALLEFCYVQLRICIVPVDWYDPAFALKQVNDRYWKGLESLLSSSLFFVFRLSCSLFTSSPHWVNYDMEFVEKRVLGNYAIIFLSASSIQWLLASRIEPQFSICCFSICMGKSKELLHFSCYRLFNLWCSF